jgi:hypothetical protein
MVSIPERRFSSSESIPQHVEIEEEKGEEEKGTFYFSVEELAPHRVT